MASIKAVLRKNKTRSDGSCPIAIRITKDRKTRYIFSGKYILEKNWDADAGKAKRSHDNSARLNAFIRSKIREIEQVSDYAEIAEEEISATQIKNKIKGSRTTISFFQLAAERIKRKGDEGVFSVAKSELSILYNLNEFLTHNHNSNIEKVKEGIKQRRKHRISMARSGKSTFEEEVEVFAKNTTLTFNDIDLAFLKRYKSFCKSYLGQKSRTITNQLIFIRTLFNQAIKERLVSKKKYPFGGDDDLINIGTSNKIGLTRDEIELIEKYETDFDSIIRHTKNIWLFSFYLAGVRISDVLELKWSEIIDGRLYYQMNKNEKPVSLKLVDPAQKILEEYVSDRQFKDDFVFPFLKKAIPNDKRDLYIKRKNATKLLNKYLKRIADDCGIEKNLSNHIARHSFGNIAGDKINPRMLQKLYRHSDLKTTLVYQANFIHRDADEALESVVGGG